MKTVWLLYILVSFNGDDKLNTYEYTTESECETEKVRIAKEFEEVYDIYTVQLYCVRGVRSTK
jgi:hypothetical protein